jgi:hypothetical protein
VRVGLVPLRMQLELLKSRKFIVVAWLREAIDPPGEIKEVPRIGVPGGLTWLGRQDSNLGMAESKSAALPLGYAPKRCADSERARYSDAIRHDQCILIRTRAGRPAGSVDRGLFRSRLVAPWRPGRRHSSHHGALDKNSSGAFPTQEAELNKNNIRYEGHIYPDSVHGFFDDATPERYNKVTARQAWARTIEWFNQHVRGQET